METTTLHPVAFAAVALACVLIFRLPRERVIIPFLFAALFVPLGQALVIGGVHFYMQRILILCGIVRTLRRHEHRGLQFTVMDKLMVGLTAAITVCYSIHHGVHDSTVAALIYRVGVAITTMGSYAMARLFIRDLADVERLVRTLAVMALLVAAAMLVEWKTGHNVFADFGGVFAEAFVRDGRTRCAGPFRVYILAGTFGGSLIPLFWGLWWQGQQHRPLAAAGVIGSLAVVITCASSGPILTLAAGVGALAFWPMRKHMRLVRWGALAGLVGLHLVMKAPVWALLGRMNVLSASTGVHRFVLVDEFIRHFGEWWFIGVPRPHLANWGFFGQLVDVTNQYVSMGIDGGVLGLALFIALIGHAFAAVGRSISTIASNGGEERLLWGLGASLFAHVVSFLGVDYSDQIVVVWCVLLGTLSAMAAAAMATVRATAKAETTSHRKAGVPTADRVLIRNPGAI